ncbi:MAG: bifunctional phosphoribosyl-AMP cyclohydrolase/phosphoribosyl-ATP diphosphatase HisIE [Saprospiraceae bacterium]
MLDFNKYADGLIPTIIQDAYTLKVLMLGFMDEKAFQKTVKDKRVTFFSRSKKRLWTKGETSGHFLDVKSISADCDGDTLLIKVTPNGPVCHTGSDTCFDEINQPGLLDRLERTIQDRFENPSESSYVSKLAEKGINKIAQKVGEEAVELVIESKDENDKLFLGEAADLLFHYLVLLRAKGFQLNDVLRVLEDRERKR